MLEPAGEDAEPVEHRLLAPLEEGVRPVERRPERPVAGIARRAAFQQPKSAIEIGCDLRGCHRGHARQPTRSRADAVEAPADLVHRGGVRRRDRERWLHRCGPIGKQRDRLGLAERSETGRVGDRQWTQRPDLFTGDAEALSARGQDAQLRTLHEQGFRELAGTFEEMLAVVEEDEQFRVTDAIDDRSLGREVRTDPRADRGSHHVGKLVGRCRRRELAEPGAVGVVAQHVGRDVDREARLTDAAGPRDRDEPGIAQCVGDAGELGVAADGST